MTLEEKDSIMLQISAILDTMIKSETSLSVSKDNGEPIKMLTLKECTTLVEGLSMHSIRLMVARGELPHIRTGHGKSGKILVPQKALEEYINNLVQIDNG